VYRQWEQLYFYSPAFSAPLTIAPYRYKMIRGINFYNHCFEALKKHSSVTFLQGKVESLFSENTTGIVVNGETLTADYVFNSIPVQNPVLQKKDIWFLQHFKGWLIETEDPAFDPNAATLMDFRISQKWGTAFCYVLPFSTTQALVEYTLFTPFLLAPEEYNEGLKAYIKDQLNIEKYNIHETEFGVIPMTDYRFSPGRKNIINIGTAGGQTKGSSGYTFYFIQQHCKAIVQRLLQNQHPLVQVSPKRFGFYDSVLLGVLQENKLPGDQIFSTLFQKNKPRDVLAFLNNASTLPTEARIISSLPTLPFLRSAVRHVF
jgi:lycopene beta-cyclase